MRNLHPFRMRKLYSGRLRSGGFKVALNTGFTRSITDTILHRLRWDDRSPLIDQVICSDEVARGRPHADMIEVLMEDLGIESPVQVLKVGDTEVDVEEGRNAGCGKVVSVTTGTCTREQLQSYSPDFIIDDLQDSFRSSNKLKRMQTPVSSSATVPPVRSSGLRGWLQRCPGWAFIVYVSLTSFTVYASMYGFRKPFTAASYDGITFLGISYKVVLVIAQVFGYMLSKFYGIRFIAGMEPAKRAGFIVKLVLTAWISLLLFGLVPAPYNIVFMFINGLPLGMVWGLVFGFLEGRRTTELMGAVLATSFIFASGLAKTVGKSMLLYAGVSETWMPFVGGRRFHRPPAPQHLAAQSNAAANRGGHRACGPSGFRWGRSSGRIFCKIFGLALIPIITAYAMLTVLRDFTEDFANELWSGDRLQK